MTKTIRNNEKIQIKSDPAMVGKMRKKDRERKKAKKDQQRQVIQSGNTKLEKYAKKHLDEKIQRQKENRKTMTNEENDQLEDALLKEKQENQRIAARKWMIEIKLQTTNDKPITSPSSRSPYIICTPS